MTVQYEGHGGAADAPEASQTDAARNEGAVGPRLVPFEVSATLPPALQGLERLARNFWWSWDPDACSLFEELSPRSWETSGHNPISLLRHAWPEDLAARAADDDYLTRLEDTLARFDAYLGAEPDEGRGLDRAHPAAYFCAEYGIHESLRMYSGGLGILAGDHLKSASDLRVPLVAVGLFYKHGYMTQRTTAAGDQIAVDLKNDPYRMAVERVLDPAGRPLEVELDVAQRRIQLFAWKVHVGRVELFLLDADHPANSAEDRDLTRNLYGGDGATRLLQEILLGRGGVRLLDRLGIEPSVVHINEGHAAFSTLERAAILMERQGLSVAEAFEAVRGSTIFTTHTPVPAGHDRFDGDFLRQNLGGLADRLSLAWGDFYALGTAAEHAESFNMTYLALNLSSIRNGVSRLHGTASRELLHPVWPGLLESEVPVTTITNGVHLSSWSAPAVGRAMGCDGRTLSSEDFRSRAPAVDLSALWSARQSGRAALLRRLRDDLHSSFVERHDSPLLLERMVDGLDERALWIGFARRFAPYKRAHLLFEDVERLRALLDHADRPVRIVIAGKAHPNDERGQEILRGIVDRTRSPELCGRVFFVDNYEIDLARSLVQGVDIWLNNPTRMLEASGTSGMKAAANGALNLSIADGWWPEGFEGGPARNGWVIGGEREYADQSLQDQLDSAALYSLLEDEIAPLFFERDAADLPQRWLEIVRRSLATIPPRFHTDRMVAEYVDLAYRPLAERHGSLAADDWRQARERASARARLDAAFGGVQVHYAHTSDLSAVRVGDTVQATVELELGALSADDVVVELVLGHALGKEDLSGTQIVTLAAQAADAGRTVYRGAEVVTRSGDYAFGLRLRARGADGVPSNRLVRWL